LVLSRALSIFKFCVAVSSLIVQVEGCLLEISSSSFSMYLVLSKVDGDHQRFERDSTP
jgi:predicted permease